MIGLYLPQAQIDRLAAGNLLTSCEPRKRIDQIDATMVANQLRSIGETFDVADENGKPVAKAVLKDCSVTTFGDPDTRLLAGMGFAEASQFQSGYGEFWKANFPKAVLTPATELFVTVWAPAS